MAQILVVEDNSEIRTNLVALFESEGFDVQAADTGVSALRVLGEGSRPDLIFLDLMLPEMDGFEVCKKLHERAEFTGIPVVVLTCLSLSAEDLGRVGNAVVLRKPVPVEDLILIARRHVAHS